MPAITVLSAKIAKQGASDVTTLRVTTAPLADADVRKQLTDNGLAAEITAKGTKYYKDDDLNKASGK